MKNLLYLFTLTAIFSMSVCIAAPTTTTTTTTTKTSTGSGTLTTTSTSTMQNGYKTTEPTVTVQNEPDYTVVSKNHENFYYDKYGKMIAHDKVLKTGTFFYNATGQFVGKSVLRGEKTYYYNSIGQFIGVCDINGACQDKNFESTGKIPPLPMVKNFKPFFDDSFLNQQKSTDEEE